MWGIDKIESTVECREYEEHTESLRAEFMAKKAEAKQQHRPSAFKAGERVFEVLPNGRRFYEYTLSHPDMILWFAEHEIQNTPPVAVAVTSEFLWRMGPRGAWEEVLNVLDYLSIPHAKSKLSRIDYCLDQDGYTLKPRDVDDIVCRSRKRDLMNDMFLAPFERRVDHHGSEWVRLKEIRNAEEWKPLKVDTYGEVRKGEFSMTGVVVGKGGNLSFRGYNKSLEIRRVSKKYWFYHLWAEAGMEPGREIWRWEFQVRRPVFRELHTSENEPEGQVTHYLDNVDDGINHGAEIWRYLTAWLQFRNRSTDSNTTRSTVREFWREAMTPPGLLPADPAGRTARVHQVIFDALWPQIRGLVAHAAAYKGGVTDPDQVGEVIADLLREDKELKRFVETVKLRRGQHYHKEGIGDVSESECDREIVQGSGATLHPGGQGGGLTAPGL